MQSQTEHINHEVLNTLPPMITSKTRVKLDAEQLSISFTSLLKKKEKRNNVIKTESPERIQRLQTMFPLKLIYFPKELNFEIGDVSVFRNVRVWNASKRSLYILCAGIQDKSENLSWRWHPRIRSLLAPGLSEDFYIKTTPKNTPSGPLVRSSRLALQLAAAHKRDNVVIHFVIPIVITFLKYIPPYLYEDG